jgi:hypothetical protein
LQLECSRYFSRIELDVVSLKVFDVLGREIAVLADEYLRAGSYERVFESADLSSGVYFYTLKADEFEKTLRMVVVR